MEEEWERRIVAAGELHLTRELERGGCESGGEGKRLRRNQGQVAEGDEDGGDVEEKEPRGRDPSRVSSRVGTWHLFGLLMSAPVGPSFCVPQAAFRRGRCPQAHQRCG